MTTRPEWTTVRAPTATQSVGIRVVREVLARHRLRTVCQAAVCPNAAECWGAKTATFMILGDLCTRACRFCAVPTGTPRGEVDVGEPMRVADAVVELGLRYVVLTSVDRDDLDDGGAAVYAESVERIKRASPRTRVELLLPDFAGNPRALGAVLASPADVLGHNVETVCSRTPEVRDRRASYEQSLAVLGFLRAGASGRPVKSGLMAGLGETKGEIVQTFSDLREAGVDVLTIGQYLRPTAEAVPVSRFVPPEEFDELGREARRHGFRAVVAGPLVRSSYRAAEAFEETCG
ncbi:lipoyl synthase [Candidatus Bipolaricaulota bacterium]